LAEDVIFNAWFPNPAEPEQRGYETAVGYWLSVIFLIPPD